MNTETLQKQFAKLGRVKVTTRPDRDRFFSLNVSQDREGEFWSVTLNEGDDQPDVQVLDVRPDEKALLLMVRDEHKSKFLMGLDEYDKKFVASIPLERGVRDVITAKEALKPKEVVESQNRANVKHKHRNKRKNDGFIRQGEWFFIPATGFEVRKFDILKKDEGFNRTGSRPHTAEFMISRGGETVYVRRDKVLSQKEFKERSKEDNFKPYLWRATVRDATVYVKGRIKAPDHKTIILDEWHIVRSNLEHEAPSKRHVAFLD